MAIAVAQVVGDRQPKGGEYQFSGPLCPALQCQVACNKRSNSVGAFPSPSARASFQPVLGLIALPRRVDLRVGYEIPARLARSVKLHPRRAQAAFSSSGTITTTKPPGPTRNGLVFVKPGAFFDGGTGCAAGSPVPPSRRQVDTTIGLIGRRGRGADGIEDEFSGLIIAACGAEPAPTSPSMTSVPGPWRRAGELREAGCGQVTRPASYPPPCLRHRGRPCPPSHGRT